jgi:hypothetical protein
MSQLARRSRSVDRCVREQVPVVDELLEDVALANQPEGRVRAAPNHNCSRARAVTSFVTKCNGV